MSSFALKILDAIVVFPLSSLGPSIAQPGSVRDFV